jgi:hypothetical protein
LTIVKEDWKSTSWNVCPELRRDYDAYIAKRGLTYTKLFNGLMLALLNGDMSVDEIPYGEQRIISDITTKYTDLINVTIRDKAGNILNPTKTFKEDK